MDWPTLLYWAGVPIAILGITGISDRVDSVATGAFCVAMAAVNGFQA